MIRSLRNKRGQAMTEYIIIVAIVAIAALAVFGLFGDRIRQMVSGATQQLGGTPTAVPDGNSLENLQNLGK
jgi:Flp pilus assembly pilin Flp